MRHLLYVFVMAGALFALPLNAHDNDRCGASATADSTLCHTGAAAVTASCATDSCTDAGTQLSCIQNSLDSCKTDVATLKSQSPNLKQVAGYGVLAFIVILLLAAVVAKIVASNVAGRKDKTADEDEQYKKSKKSADRTAMKLANAEKRIAALEKQLQLLSAQMRSTTQPSVNSGAAQGDSKSATTAKPEPDTFYMPQPSGEREFDNASLSYKQKDDTVYVFHRKGAGKAEFELGPAGNTLFWVMENKQQAIETVCDVMQDNGGTAVATLTPGTAEFSGGKWIVKQKAQVIIR